MEGIEGQEWESGFVNQPAAVSRNASQAPDPVNLFFELSYANYLVIPRSVLEAMPDNWQRRFVECLEELDEAIDWRPKEGECYQVTLRDVEESGRNPEWGAARPDPLANYRHPPNIEVEDIWSEEALEK